MSNTCIRNPFSIGIIQDEHSFCDRVQEKEELIRYARNGDNVVLISPRRYGKSSLVGRVLESLEQEGYLTAYVDLFPVTSENDFVSRLASGLFKGIGKGIDPRSFLEKAGHLFRQLVPTYEMTHEGSKLYVRADPGIKTEVHIEDLLAGMYEYVEKSKLRAIVCLDEFQEITELPQAKKLEGILRSQMQRHRDISYFYVGSRRRVLQEIFSSRSRPFYKSAYTLVLKEIPRGEIVPYLEERFQSSGKQCRREAAELMYDLVRGYPYYVQKLASIAWDMVETVLDYQTVKDHAYPGLVKVEHVDFEGTWSGLSLNQKALLRAVAEEPTPSPFARVFLQKHNLSVGGAQGALKVLLEKDLVEQDEEKRYRVTDPVMGAWIKNA